jgi:hypothetical protein
VLTILTGCGTVQDHGTVKFKLRRHLSSVQTRAPMADLTEYEQDLLRRNALLEERAAASIARAKAVVEGSAVLASQEWSAGEIAGKSSLFEDAMLKLARDEVEHFAAGDVTLDSVDYESDDPPPPPDHEEWPDENDPEPPRFSRHFPATKSARSSRPTSVRSSVERVTRASRDSAPLEEFGRDAPAASFAKPEEDSAGRLARARIRALQDELQAQAKELREAHARLKDRDGELKSLLTEKLNVGKQVKQMQVALDKEKRAASDAKAAAEAKERELAETKKEIERDRRSNKAADAEAKAKDVRLNRALEEVERYKHQLEQAREGQRGAATGLKGENDRLRQEVKRLERQKTELVAAFKKQMKLIDVLKKQKVHMEAARTLQFAEEEFMRTLDTDAR